MGVNPTITPVSYRAGGTRTSLSQATSPNVETELSQSVTIVRDSSTQLYDSNLPYDSQQPYDGQAGVTRDLVVVDTDHEKPTLL